MSDGRVWYERWNASEHDGVIYRPIVRLGHVTPPLWSRRIRIATPAWRTPNEDGAERTQAPDTRGKAQ